MYLLDTNACIAYLNDRNSMVAHRLMAACALNWRRVAPLLVLMTLLLPRLL
jgi:predicted nucleic acid-binding protein